MAWDAISPICSRRIHVNADGLCFQGKSRQGGYSCPRHRPRIGRGSAIGTEFAHTPCVGSIGEERRLTGWASAATSVSRPKDGPETMKGDSAAWAQDDLAGLAGHRTEGEPMVCSDTAPRVGRILRRAGAHALTFSQRVCAQALGEAAARRHGQSHGDMAGVIVWF